MKTTVCCKTICEVKFVDLKNLPKTIFSNEACMIKCFCKQMIKGRF
jgi:hypothetical protein